jgi:hypothetical protein
MKKMPARTNAVNLKLAVLSSAFTGRSAAGLAMEQYQFDYTNTVFPAKEIMIESNAPAGNLAIVVLAIEPVQSNKGFDAAWLPAAIIGMGRLKL